MPEKRVKLIKALHEVLSAHYPELMKDDPADLEVIIRIDGKVNDLFEPDSFWQV